MLNVSAYRAGDFHIFFDDPRTREDYLKWAPLLLVAEEWIAGNASGVPEPEKPKYNNTPSWFADAARGGLRK